MEISKKVFSVVIISFLWTCTIYAQSPDTIWTKTFGGTGYDYGYAVQQTNDGGYIIVGSSTSYGSGYDDVWLIKTDDSGSEVFNKTYGGSLWDIGRSGQQTSDNGYIVVGETRSFGGGLYDIWLLKTDQNGDTSWVKTFGGSHDDYGYSVQQTDDGGYIITGCTETFGAGAGDVWLIKTDGSGNTTWSKTYGGSSIDIGNSVQQTNDGGYIIVGSTESFGAGYSDVWLLKTDASGDTSWTKTYGGGSPDKGYSVQEIGGEGYIITGSTDSYGPGASDVWLIKTDATGNTIWSKAYGYSGYSNEEGFSIQQTVDNGYIVTGITGFMEGQGGDVWLLKTKSDGDTLWTSKYGISTSQCTDCGRMVQQTSDNGYIIVGYTRSYGSGIYDVWLIKTEPDIGTEEESGSYVKHSYRKTIINGPIELPEGKRCKVFDISGRQVKPAQVRPGIYFIEIDGLVTQKVIKVR